MKRVVALLGIAWLLACAGNALPCMGTETCVAADACCDPEDTGHGECPPGPDCPCCPQLRPAVPAVEIAVSLPLEARATVAWPMTAFHPSPSPREILHVPKLGASVA